MVVLKIIGLIFMIIAYVMIAIIAFDLRRNLSRSTDEVLKHMNMQTVAIIIAAITMITGCVLILVS